MKYLQAANPSQINARPADFFFANPGEMVVLGGLICTNPQKRQACGCDRSLGGITSMLATTVFVVAEASEKVIRSQFTASEMVAEYRQIVPLESLFHDSVLLLSQAVANYPVGTYLRIAQSPENFRLLPV